MSEKSVQDRKEHAKLAREERRSRSADQELEESFDFIDATQASDGSYSSLVARKILAVDLSHQSTYVQLGIGGATGWFTGYMVGKVGKALAGAVGGTILLINMGTRGGYITVDWDKVDEDMRNAGEEVSKQISEQQNNRNTKRLLEKGSIFVRRNLVMVGGFAAGFFLGMAS